MMGVKGFLPGISETVTGGNLGYTNAFPIAGGAGGIFEIAAGGVIGAAAGGLTDAA